MHNSGRSGTGRRVSSLGRQSEAPSLLGGREAGRRAGAHGRPTDRRELLGSPGHPTRSSAERPLVSVVVPAFNEAAGIQATIRILSATLQACDCEPEIVVVDDGSRDATFERAAELSDIGLPVRVLRLS
jgi:hypothetical protein